MNNDWRDYALLHSWGTKPEQKKREKEYNHQYWLDHKEEILKKRRERNGDTVTPSEEYESRQKKLQSDNEDENYKGVSVSTIEELNKRVAGEVDDIEALIKANAELGGYSDDVLENIRQHNQNIIDNITALTERVEAYIKENNLSGDAQNEYLAKIADQIDKQMNLALDLTNDSTHKYLEDLGAKKVESSSEKSSSSSSKKSSTKDEKEDKEEKQEEKDEEDDDDYEEDLDDEDEDNTRHEDEYYEEMRDAYLAKKKARKLSHGLEIYEETLAHHGVIGQAWGKRNGPPYPLSRAISTGKALVSSARKKASDAKVEKANKKAKEEAERKSEIKKSVINSGDAKLVDTFKSKLTLSEYEEAVRRCELTKRLDNSKINSSSTVDSAFKKVGKVTNYAKTGIEAWNTFSTIYNTMNEEPLVRINGQYYENQKKNKR